jgi:hypothetical protein
VIECAPGFKAFVVIEAFPLVSVLVPNVEVPSRKVIVPVGTDVPDCGTATAERVTLCPLLI